MKALLSLLVLVALASTALALTCPTNCNPLGSNTVAGQCQKPGGFACWPSAQTVINDPIIKWGSVCGTSFTNAVPLSSVTATTTGCFLNNQCVKIGSSYCLNLPTQGSTASWNMFLASSAPCDNLSQWTRTQAWSLSATADGTVSCRPPTLIAQQSAPSITLTSSKPTGAFVNQDVTYSGVVAFSYTQVNQATKAVLSSSVIYPAGTVTVTVNGVSNSSAVASDGSYSVYIPVDKTIEQGVYRVSASFSPQSVTGVYANGTTSSLSIFTSASTAINQTFNPIQPIVAVTPSHLSAEIGGPTVSFLVTLSSAFNPVGAVTYSLDGGAATSIVLSAVDSVPTTLTLTVPFPGLAVGTHNLVVSFAGDGRNLAATGSGSTVITKAHSTITVYSSNPSAPVGTPITFTGTVSGYNPTGTVTLTVNGQTFTTTLNGTFSYSVDVGVLPAGSYPVSVTYGGDNNNFDSSSTISQEQKQIITKVNPSITIDDTPDPSVIGQTVTFSGFVTGIARLIPTGTVALTIGSISSGPITLAANGAFTFTTSSLAVGQIAYFAEYSGDANYNTLVAAQTHTVNPAPSTTTVVSSVNPSASGADVVFSGQVTGYGTPTGSVTLTVNSQVYTLPLTNGQYTSSAITLHTGSYPVNVHYNGDDNNLESSTGLTQNVNVATPTLTVEVNPNPSVVGTSVTYSGSVQGDSATGSVLITVRGVTFSAGLDSNSNYRYTTSAGDAGTFPVSASYAGDANNGPASASASQTVNKVPTTVSLVSSKNPSGSSESVTFTGVVSADGYVPTGSVTLKFNNGGAITAALNAQGQYSATVSNLVAASGPYTVDVAYPGDKNSLASSNEMTQIVQKSATTITLVDNPAPSSAGQTVTFSGSVSGDRPSGNVVLTFLGQSITVALDSASQFSTSAPFVSAGSFSVSAHYHGDGNNEPADAALTHVVTKVPTTTTIVSSLSSSVVGDSVLFTGSVSNGLTNVPVTGTIALTIDSAHVADILVNPLGGFSYSSSELKVGSFQVSAAYSGDSNNFASSASTSQTVTKATPVIALSSSLNPSVYGDSVNFGGIVVGVHPTGFVTVTVDGSVLGVVALDASGIYSVSTSALEVGSHTVVADYSGDTQNNPLSTSIVQEVDKAPTTTVADTNVDPVGAGNPFTVFGTVSGKNPTGSVSITIDGVTSTATLVDGSYSLPVPSGLTTGNYTIAVAYAGDAHNLPSSGTATVSVVPDPSALSLVSSLNPSPVGVSVTFSGQVLDGLNPTGSVTLTIDGVLTTTVALDSNAKYTYSTDKLTTGTHLVVANYLGDVNNEPSSASLQQKVDPVATTVSIASSSNPSQAGQTVVFSGTVSGGFKPTGNVQIDIDGLYYLVAIDSSYSYSFTSAALTAGDHSVTVNYLGDTNNLPSSNLLTQSVNKAPTTISEVSSQNPAEVGTSVTISGSVNGGYNPTGSVTISLDGATYSVPLVNGAYSFPLPASIAVGDHDVNVAYSGDSNNLPSTNFITQTIQAAASAITLVSSLNPSVVSNEVVFSGSVTGYHVSGTITLEIGEDSYSVPLNNGQYQYSTSSLSAGDYVVVANYPGDSNNKASTAQLTQTVRPGPSTVTIVSSKNPAVAGESVTFSGTVSGYFPTGTVTVTIAGVPQTITLTNSGYSLAFPSGFDAGSIAVDVKYNGDANNLPSTSELIQLVNAASTTVTVVSSQNPSTVGNAVTFSGVVTGYGNVDGPLTLSVGGTPISLTVQGGAYTYTTATLSVGSAPVVAQYLGNANNAASSASLTQVVQPAPSTITISSSKNPSVAGDDVTFSGTVSGFNPTGLVLLSLGSTTNVSLTLTDAGAYTYTTTGGLDAGSINVKVYYLGDSQNLPSQNSLVQTVSKDDSSITISSSKNPSIIGDSVTFSGYVSGDNPTGTVAIYIDGTKASEAAVGSDFSYSFTTARLPVGDHNVEARYLGDNNNDPDTASLVQVVKQSPSVTTIVSSANPSPAGQTVTFSGTVTGFNPTGSVVLTFLDQTVSVALSNGAYTFTTNALDAGTFLVTATYGGDVNNVPSSAQVYETVQPVPTQITITSDKPTATAGDSVTFSGKVTGGVGVGGENITLTIDGVSYPVTLASDGSYSFTAPNLPAGTKTVHVEYPGNSNSQPSDATLQQPVVPANTVTSLTSSLNPATVGDSVTFSGAVTGGSSPTGTVTIYIDGTPTAPIPIGSDGSYSYPTSGLPPGSHNITAVYSGDGNNNPSTATLTENVLKGSPTITVASSLNPAPRPSTITFSGFVSGGFNPTGTVTLTIGSQTFTVTLVGNAYTYTTASDLAPGTYSVVAKYNGDANNNVATASLTQVVNKADVTITLASSLNPSVYQTAVTFSGVVSGYNPTGTVTLTFSSGLSASVTLDASSKYTYTTSALPVGVITVTANYNGDSNNGVATTSITQTVTATQSALTLVSSKNPSTFKDSVTFSGKVTGILPTGTVQLYDDGVAMGSPITLVNAQYSYTTSTLTVGNHNISAAYSGDLVNKRDYASLIQTVRVAPTTVTIVTSPNPSDAGQAFVASGAVTGVTPTGSVVLTWTSGTATVPLSAGSYTYSFPNGLPAGSYPFTVNYNGDANNGPSTASLVHQVNKVATTTVVTTSASPVVVGTSVTFSGSVQGGYQVGGTITLTIGSSSVTLTLGAGATFTYTPPNPLIAGTYTVTASYPGDQNNKPSSGSTTQIVNLSTVTITVVSSLNPSTYGQSVAFSGVVTGYNPSGTVTLYDGTAVLASGLPLDAQKKYTFQTTSLLSVATHVIKAVYSGDNNNQAAQATLNQVVNKAPTTTTVVSSANPSVFGQQLTFTGTVSAAVGTPSGTVTLSAPGLSSPLTATLTNGAYSFTGLSLPLGTTAVTVAYGGDANYLTSTASLNQVVNKDPTATTIQAQNNPAVFGESVTVSGQVSATAPGQGTPTGTVTIKEGTTVIGTATLSGGSYSLGSVQLSVGVHTLVAYYGSDGNFLASQSVPYNLTVNKAPTSTSLQISSNTCQNGGTVTLTGKVVAVAPGAGLPSGTVTIFDNNVAIGTATVTTSTGAFTFTPTSPSQGSHTYYAVYNGDASFLTSQSPPVSLAVGSATTTTTIVSSVNPSAFKQSTTFSGKVTASNGVIPTGSVTLTYGSGTSIGTATLSNGQYSFAFANLPLGSSVVRATFAATQTLGGSFATLTQVVNAIATTTTVTSSVNPSAFGQSVTFTATVTAAVSFAGAPTGTVSLYDGATLLAGSVALTNGVAVFPAVSTLAVGSHSLTVSFTPSVNYFLSSTGYLTQTVRAAATTTTITTTTNPSQFSKSVTISVTVAAVAPATGTPSPTVTIYDYYTVPSSWLVYEGTGPQNNTNTTLRSNVALTNGRYSFSTTSFAVGTHTLVAVYPGSSAFLGSFGSVVHVVTCLPGSSCVDGNLCTSYEICQLVGTTPVCASRNNKTCSASPVEHGEHDSNWGGWSGGEETRFKYHNDGWHQGEYNDDEHDVYTTESQEKYYWGQCHYGQCNPTTGQCDDYVRLPNGTACDTGYSNVHSGVCEWDDNYEGGKGKGARCVGKRCKPTCSQKNFCLTPASSKWLCLHEYDLTYWTQSVAYDHDSCNAKNPIHPILIRNPTTSTKVGPCTSVDSSNGCGPSDCQVQGSGDYVTLCVLAVAGRTYNFNLNVTAGGATYTTPGKIIVPSSGWSSCRSYSHSAPTACGKTSFNFFAAEHHDPATYKYPELENVEHERTAAPVDDAAEEQNPMVWVGAGVAGSIVAAALFIVARRRRTVQEASA